MNILIYEITHYEIANVLLQIYAGNNITLVTTSDLLPFIALENDVQVILITKLNIYATIKIVRFRRSFNQLIIGSISYNYLLHYLLFQKLKAARKLLFIHDVNNFFQIPTNANYKTRINFRGKRLFEKDINWDYNLLYSNLNSALYRLSKKKNVINIPGGIYNEQLYKCPSWNEKQINIVIPGSVSTRRRDYELVYNLIISLIGMNYNRFKFILLGDNQLTPPLKNKFQQFSNTENIVQLFDENVDAVMFQHVCECAHLFLFPTIQNFKPSNGVGEIYGETKASGNIGDAIKYGKPFMYPQNLIIPSELKSGAINYENVVDLLSKITRLNESSFDSLSRVARENASQFSIKNIQEYLKKRDYL